MSKKKVLDTIPRLKKKRGVVSDIFILFFIFFFFTWDSFLLVSGRGNCFLSNVGGKFFSLIFFFINVDYLVGS